MYNHVNGLMQDCSISITNALAILQSALNHRYLEWVNSSCSVFITISFQECPSIGRGAAIKAVFNPCPGKEHFLTLLFTNDHDPFLDYNRPLAAGFLAIYDTQKCEYYLIARDQWVAADVLVHSRDGAFLFVRCDTECRIQMLDAESLEVKASVSHDATSFLPTFESYQFWYPFFPMMSADSLSIAVLDRNRSGNSILDAEENVTVSVYPIPFKLTRGLSLKDVCRRHIRALVPDDRHVELLPLPRPLYKYLLWQNQGASGDWNKPGVLYQF